MAIPAATGTTQSGQTEPTEAKPTEAKPKMTRAQETRQLLAELRTIPVSEYAINLMKYERLLQLHPDDETFARKVSFYSDKLNAKRAATY